MRKKSQSRIILFNISYICEKNIGNKDTSPLNRRERQQFKNAIGKLSEWHIWAGKFDIKRYIQDNK